MDLIKQGVVARGILAQEHAPPNWALQAASLGSLLQSLQNALKTGRLGGLGRGEGGMGHSSTSALEAMAPGVRAFLGPWGQRSLRVAQGTGR